MKITKTDGPPKDVLYFDEEYKDDELDLSPQDVEDVAEIFKTPLTGSYNWDYTVAVSYTHLTLPTIYSV